MCDDILPRDKKTFIYIAVITLLFLTVFSPLYASLFERYNAHDSYYSHGILVPFVSIFLVWRKRKRLAALPVRPVKAGLAFIIAGLIIHLVSIFLKINVTSYFAIPVVITGMVVYLGGWQVAKTLWFPIAFLAFMLPLPKVLIIGIAFRMKEFAAMVSTQLVNMLGVKARQVGSTIYYPGGYLLVGNPCSGLRSLISFLALGALFTQFTNASLIRKYALFAATVPVALLSNIVRIMILIMAGYIYGEKVALGALHDISGVLVFALGFLGLVGVSKILRCPLTVDAT